MESTFILYMTTIFNPPSSIESIIVSFFIFSVFLSTRNQRILSSVSFGTCIKFNKKIIFGKTSDFVIAIPPLKDMLLEFLMYFWKTIFSRF